MDVIVTLWKLKDMDLQEKRPREELGNLKWKLKGRSTLKKVSEFFFRKKTGTILSRKDTIRINYQTTGSVVDRDETQETQVRESSLSDSHRRRKSTRELYEVQ